MHARASRSKNTCAWPQPGPAAAKVTGTAKKLKEKIPGIQIVAVDPYGSILAKPESKNDASPRTGHKKLQGYHVEGIGYDFVPTVLDQDVVDHWVKTDDDESFSMGRNVVRHEGLLCYVGRASSWKVLVSLDQGGSEKMGPEAGGSPQSCWNRLERARIRTRSGAAGTT